MPTLQSRKKLTAFHKFTIVQRRILSFFIIGFLSVSLLNVGCNKLDTTDIGGDILPGVDNIRTFADTLSITTTQGIFSPDTTVVTRTDDHAIGFTNDPVFGTTTAGAYFQLKPSYFPYSLGNTGDTISPLNLYGTGFDSVVLCMKYKGFYGDSSQPLDLELKEVNDAGFRDNTNKPNDVNYKPTTILTTLGSTTVRISKLADTVHYFNNKDKSVNVIRIRITDVTWLNRLYRMDSVSFHTGINGYYNDSNYRRFFHGLAVVPKSGGSGNQLIYVNLADISTRLEVHFRRRNNGLPVDTVFAPFTLNTDFFGTPSYRSSNTANNIVRVRPALPSGDQEIYLQTNPGTFANLKIPGLTGLSNRIVHRAELIVEQIPDASMTTFKAPNFLYLDLKDSGTSNKWKPIYFDLNTATSYDPDYKNPFSVPFYPNSGIDNFYFGGFKKEKVDKFGNTISYYNFNVTKYVQDIATNHRANYDMRLFPAFAFSYPQYAGTVFNYGNSIAYGRLKVGGGNNANYKMRMRIVYSTY